MLRVKIQLSRSSFELFIGDRTISTYAFYKDKILFSFEKSFPRSFNCISCKERVEQEEHSMRLCELCLDEYMRFWRKRLK